MRAEDAEIVDVGRLEAAWAGFVQAGLLTSTAIAVAATVANAVGARDDDVVLAWALAVAAPRRGAAGVRLDELLTQAGVDPVRFEGELPWPAPRERWLDAVEAAVARAPRGLFRIEHGLLLTGRYAALQDRIAARVCSLAAASPGLVVPPARVAGLLEEVYGAAGGDGGANDEARAAGEAFCARSLLVLSGGPGSGKSYGTGRLIDLLARASSEAGLRPPRVALAAPTGRAAGRMGEALAEGQLSDAARVALADAQPQTVHRLLGSRPFDGTFARNASNPLDADLVVVDEASMLDLELFGALLDAIPPGARLVLLGDADQLASVEAGTVLADLVAAGDAPALQGCVHRLTGMRRFAAESAIGQVATTLRTRAPGFEDRATEQLTTPSDQLHHTQLPDGHAAARALRDALSAAWVAALQPALGDDRKLIAALASLRVICAHRRGRLGADALNRDLCTSVRRALGVGGRDDAFAGMPVMVLRNDPELGVANGDVGALVADEAGLALVLEGGDAPRRVALARLPAWAPAFATTVHQAQGSQFGHVHFVLGDRESPVLTRELLYTALTRAKERVTWYGGAELLRASLSRDVRRASGLEPRLRAAGA